MARYVRYMASELWHPYLLCIICIIATMGDSEPFSFFPVGDYSKYNDLKVTIHMIKNYFAEMGWKFKFKWVSVEQLSHLNKLEINFYSNEDRDNFDYLHYVKSLPTLAGKKLDGKRNHVNKFKKL
jgi:Uncharacterized conserved protein